MSDLIFREEVLSKAFCAGLVDAQGNFYGSGHIVLADDILKAPTVDAEPVVHAHWVREPTETFGSTDYDYHCSACKSYPVKDVLTKRCPVCGAKMDEVRE